MTKVFHEHPDGRLAKIKYNPRRKILERMHQGSVLFEALSVMETMKESQSSLEEKNPSILKDNFSLKTDPTIFISTATEFLPKSTKSHSLD